jgi:hypothetical protein
MSIELYGAGPKGTMTETQGREQKITRNPDFLDTSTRLNNVSKSSGFLSLATRESKAEKWQKYKALVLGKNITIDAETSAGNNEFLSTVTPGNPWSILSINNLVFV